MALCVALAGVGAGIASAQRGAPVSESWARIKVCSPTELGARAQLAGDGTKSEMSVAFEAQWLSPTGWEPLAGAATSPSLSAGSAEYTWGQAGWTYQLTVPPGFAYQLRAVAQLQWPNGRSETLVTGTCALNMTAP